jgi:hypothetical protein
MKNKKTTSKSTKKDKDRKKIKPSEGNMLVLLTIHPS